MAKYFNCAILILLLNVSGIAQITDSGAECYVPIIDQISELESNKDPKCHATASRLEDFMFGTPLDAEARISRIDHQKTLIRHIWSKASEISDSQDKKVKEEQIILAANEYLYFAIYEDKWYVQLTKGEKIEIDQTDFRQYSSIAYGLRAILAVQQESLFDVDNQLKVLETNAVNRLKFIVDLVTLTTLKIADYEARTNNLYEIGEEQIQNAWKQVIQAKEHSETAFSPDPVTDYSKLSADFEMTYQTIAQKLKSFEAYNQIGQSVFLRNIQVYFAKMPWPKDTEESSVIENNFRESLIYFAMDVLLFAENLSKNYSEPVISYTRMKSAIDAFFPYSVNQFEDVTYFPLVPKDRRVIIESYDLDAFRDSGVHWQYLKFALDDPNFKGSLEPDPFALELLVEGIAQLGVLVWRQAGIHAKKQNSSELTSSAMLAGLEEIRELIKMNNSRYGAEDIQPEGILSSEAGNNDLEGKYFEDVTPGTGINYEHRSSDWLSRLIRSYVIKEDEQLARLAIPPAFGGGGVAAEDLDGDGWVDVLLLGGLGNRLYKNKGNGTFEDITKSSGLLWQREDGQYGEPRQPIIADFNNDGIQDIFISYVNDDHKIFEGNGDGTFEDVSQQAQLGGAGLVGGPCTALDYDRDGLLDLYIGYFGNYLKGELPTLERHNTNGTSNRLYRNMGNFQFKDVSENSGVQNNGWTQAVGHSDINNDGWQDLIVGNDFGINSYYINQGDGTFVDKSASLGTNKPSYTMNVGIADLNRDQLPDFYISNIVVMEKDDKYVSPNKDTRMHFNTSSLATMRVVEANDLFISNRKGKDQLEFERSELIGRGYSSTGWAWDADFFDFDNDGDEDLYCLNGMNDYSVYGSENEYYSSPEGKSESVTFAESSRESNVFFENESGLLNNQSAKSGLDFHHTSRSAAYLDYDNDGDLDVVVNNYHGEAYFFENKAEKLGRNWIKIELLSGNAQGITRDVIGAKVLASTAVHRNIWREVHSTTGYLSGHPKLIHIGLGNEEKLDLKIIWPDGVTTKHNIDKLNRTIRIERKGKKARLI